MTSHPFRSRLLVAAIAAALAASLVGVAPASAGLSIPAPSKAVPSLTKATRTELKPSAIASRLLAKKSQLSASGCGRGMRGIRIFAAATTVCVHKAADKVPHLHPIKNASAMKPNCYGNGVNGFRVQLVYAFVDGKPNRSAQIVPKILNTWVPKMEGVVRQTSKEQGREIGLRLHSPGCRLGVSVVSIPKEIAYPGPGDSSQPGLVMNYLYERGFNKIDRKYMLWLDEASSVTGVCGVAPLLNAPVAGDNPTPVTPHNLGSNEAISYVAIAFRANNQMSRADNCWGNGAMGAKTEMHELLHTLGAVQSTAPNSNKMGHCTDDLDIMCYSEGGVKTRPRCAVRVELLDCGMDDYFHARPPAGSYLSTHWNVAQSSFFDHAVGLDLVPLEVRP